MRRFEDNVVGRNIVTESDLLHAARRVMREELERPVDKVTRAALVEPEADRQALVAFFTTKDPGKLQLVDEILEKFRGKEPTMYESLITQYGIKRTNPYKDEIIKYYERHNPSRICAVDLILDLYEGQEEQLMFLLINKYQPDSPLRVWCRYIDANTGKEYFHNRITQEVQWELPSGGYLVEPDKNVIRKAERVVTPVASLSPQRDIVSHHTLVSHHIPVAHSPIAHSPVIHARQTSPTVHTACPSPEVERPESTLGIMSSIEQEPALCEVCHAVCTGFEELASHKEEQNHGQWYPCGVEHCPFQFPSHHSLLLHRLQIHQSSSSPQ